MKMNKFFAMALPLCAGALLAGCNDAAVEEEVAPAPTATTYTISATIEKDADGTRTNLVKVDGEEAFRNNWEEGDQVSIFPYGNANRVGKLTSGAGTDVAEFKWEYSGTETVGTHYGVFPYNAEDYVDNTTIHTKLPIEQTYNEGSFGGQNAYMTAYSEVSDGGYTFNYQYYHGALGIQLYGDAVVDKIRVTADRDIAGKVTIKTPYLTTAGYPVAEIVGTDTENKNTVTFNCGANGDLTGTTASSPKTFNISLLPGIITNLKVEVLDAAGNVLLTKTATNKNIEIKRNVIKTMARFQVKKAASTTVVDLSANGTYANCYIVTKAGGYKFAAKKVSTTAITGINKVVWVWKTEGIDITDVKSENGYIYFTNANFTEGSACIAAIDANGTTLNTWHIWFTDQPADISTGAGLMMDRNLGAITTDVNDVNSYGFLYQWGRLNPLTNEVEGSLNCMPKPNPEVYNIYGDDWYISNDWCSANTAHNFPLKFMYNCIYFNSYANTGLSLNFSIADLNSATYNWINGAQMYQDDGLGVDIDHNTAYDKLWSSTKTNMDPCPYGYRVPTLEQLDNLTFDDVKKLPTQGYMSYNGEICNVNAEANIWSTKTYNKSLIYLEYTKTYWDGSYTDYAYRTYQIGAYSFCWTPSTEIGSNNLVRRSVAMPVRCIKQ